MHFTIVLWAVLQLASFAASQPTEPLSSISSAAVMGASFPPDVSSMQFDYEVCGNPSEIEMMFREIALDELVSSVRNNRTDGTAHLPVRISFNTCYFMSGIKIYGSGRLGGDSTLVNTTVVVHSSFIAGGFLLTNLTFGEGSHFIAHNSTLMSDSGFGMGMSSTFKAVAVVHLDMKLAVNANITLFRMMVLFSARSSPLASGAISPIDQNGLLLNVSTVGCAGPESCVVAVFNNAFSSLIDGEDKPYSTRDSILLNVGEGPIANKGVLIIERNRFEEKGPAIAFTSATKSVVGSGSVSILFNNMTSSENPRAIDAVDGFSFLDLSAGAQVEVWGNLAVGSGLFLNFAPSARSSSQLSHAVIVGNSAAFIDLAPPTGTSTTASVPDSADRGFNSAAIATRISHCNVVNNATAFSDADTTISITPFAPSDESEFANVPCSAAANVISRCGGARTSLYTPSDPIAPIDSCFTGGNNSAFFAYGGDVYKHVVPTPSADSPTSTTFAPAEDNTTESSPADDTASPTSANGTTTTYETSSTSSEPAENSTTTTSDSNATSTPTTTTPIPTSPSPSPTESSGSSLSPSSTSVPPIISTTPAATTSEQPVSTSRPSSSSAPTTNSPSTTTTTAAPYDPYPHQFVLYLHTSNHDTALNVLSSALARNDAVLSFAFVREANAADMDAFAKATNTSQDVMNRLDKAKLVVFGMGLDNGQADPSAPPLVPFTQVQFNALAYAKGNFTAMLADMTLMSAAMLEIVVAGAPTSGYAPAPAGGDDDDDDDTTTTIIIVVVVVAVVLIAVIVGVIIYCRRTKNSAPSYETYAATTNLNSMGDAELLPVGKEQVL